MLPVTHLYKSQNRGLEGALKKAAKTCYLATEDEKSKSHAPRIMRQKVCSRARVSECEERQNSSLCLPAVTYAACNLHLNGQKSSKFRRERHGQFGHGYLQNNLPTTST